MMRALQLNEIAFRYRRVPPDSYFRRNTAMVGANSGYRSLFGALHASPCTDIFLNHGIWDHSAWSAPATE